MDLLKAEGMGGVHVFLGGIIPEEDIPELKACGVAEVYGPGTSTEKIATDIQAAVRPA